MNHDYVVMRVSVPAHVDVPVLWITVVLLNDLCLRLIGCVKGSHLGLSTCCFCLVVQSRILIARLINSSGSTLTVGGSAGAWDLLGGLEMSQGNLVLVGNKPLMNYVVASLTILNKGENELTLRARGKAITTAVDAAEMLRRVFVKGLAVKSINIDSEEVTSRSDEKFSISVIEITLNKK